ncbi:MAG TPA: Gfo/Idh/MocA family oxidoreductase [Pyrinomonadaceae bacterium]|nr:Gfo/Idh/MocA family oxidoreductase [Pyrinomonadaceae bacterium]
MAIRIAVVGMGCRGRDWVREVKAAAPVYELAACVDVEESALQHAAAQLRIPSAQCFTSLEEALDSSACEAVIIASPADTHATACEAALVRKLPVLIEKPFTPQLSDAVRLVSLAEANNTPLLVGQNYRYLRSFRSVKRLIDEGALGQVAMVTCHYYRPFHTMAASLARLSHSVLWGVSVHHLDMLRYVLSTQVTNVVADSFTAPWGRLPQGASLQLMLSMANQTRVSYSATYESTGHTLFEGGQEFYARFIGERATLHVFHRWLILWQNGRLPRLVRRGPRPKTEERILLEQFERAVRHGETTELSGRDNLQTVAVLEACVQSANQGRAINPQELLREY